MNFNDIPKEHFEAPFSSDSLLENLHVPPQSIEAESCVLSGLLLDKNALEIVGDLLIESDFYRNEHRLIFGSVLALAGSLKAIDVITVFEHLQSVGKAEEIGGLVYLNAIAQYAPSSGNLRRYAEIVREKAKLRELVAAADEIRALAFTQNGDSVAQRIDAACEKVQAIQVAKNSSEPQIAESLMAGFISRIEDLSSGKEEAGMPTKIPTLDRMNHGGLRGGKLIAIGARPSIGKSSLALTLAKNIANGGYPAAYLSMEMSKSEQISRLVSSAGRVDHDFLQTGKTEDDDQWGRLIEGVEKTRELPLFFDDQASLSLSDIQGRARRLKRAHGLAFLVIDYLQLCKTSAKADNRNNAIGEISRGLKQLAMQLDICVLVLSQLNREAEKRGKPMMADLKESGDIEQDCDLIALLSVADESDDCKTICMDIVKNRSGKTGKLALRFEGRYQTWGECVYDFNAKKGSRGYDL